MEAVRHRTKTNIISIMKTLQNSLILVVIFILLSYVKSEAQTVQHKAVSKCTLVVYSVASQKQTAKLDSLFKLGYNRTAIDAVRLNNNSFKMTFIKY